MDALVKRSVTEVPVAYVGTIRYLIQTSVLLLVVRASSGTFRPPPTSSFFLQVLRGLLLLGATITFWVALKFIPLSEASALAALSPVIAAVLAITFLGERSGPRQRLAIATGAVGALLIVQPGTSLFSPAALLALGTALSYASFEVITRGIGARDPAVTTLLYTGLVGLGAMSLGLTLGPVPSPSASILLVVALISVCGMAGHYFLIRALQLAPVPIVTPISYTSLLWATIYGYLLFGQVPNALAIGGMVVIGLGGLLLVTGRSGMGPNPHPALEDEIEAGPWP
jgi:S-adenosylmethionine uptake transporter